jgi:hypothetical protein
MAETESGVPELTPGYVPPIPYIPSTSTGVPEVKC